MTHDATDELAALRDRVADLERERDSERKKAGVAHDQCNHYMMQAIDWKARAETAEDDAKRIDALLKNADENRAIQIRRAEKAEADTTALRAENARLRETLGTSRSKLDGIATLAFLDRPVTHVEALRQCKEKAESGVRIIDSALARTGAGNG